MDDKTCGAISPKIRGLHAENARLKAELETAYHGQRVLQQLNSVMAGERNDAQDQWRICNLHIVKLQSQVKLLRDAVSVGLRWVPDDFIAAGMNAALAATDPKEKT